MSLIKNMVLFGTGLFDGSTFAKDRIVEGVDRIEVFTITKDRRHIESFDLVKRKELSAIPVVTIRNNKH